MTNDEGGMRQNDEARMTNDEGMTKSECRKRSAIRHPSFGFVSSFSLFSDSPDFREDEVQLSGFHHSSRASGFSFGTARTDMRRKNFVSRASFLQVAMHFKNSRLETESSASV
jgi:hypothetical protein